MKKLLRIIFILISIVIWSVSMIKGQMLFPANYHNGRNITDDDDFNGNFTVHPSGNLYQITSLVCGFLIIPIGVVGIVSNFLTIYVFTRPYMSTSINVLLTGLAAIDCILLFIGTPSFALVTFYDSSDEKMLKVMNYFIMYGYPIATMAQTASVWCIFATSLETYLAVCCPLMARIVSNPKRARKVLFFIMSAAILYNFCRFFEYEIVHNRLCPLLRKYPFYLRYYIHWLYFFLIFLIPLFALIIFNALTVKGVKKARLHGTELSRQENQEHEVAFTMVFVVLVFFMCNSLAFIVNAIEANQSEICYTGETCNLIEENNVAISYNDTVTECVDSTLFFCLVDINNLLVEINSSFNFVIYCTFNRRFRKHFCRLLPCKWSLSNRPTSDNDNGAQQELLRY